MNTFYKETGHYYTKYKRQSFIRSATAPDIIEHAVATNTT